MQEFFSAVELLVMLLSDLHTGVLIAMLALAAVIDIRSYRIPNWLTASGIVFALVYNGLAPVSPQQGFLWALEGMGIGFLLTLPLYVLKTMGAGDVKLMAMVGAFVGIPAVLYTVLASFIVGGLAAIAYALWHRAMGRMLGNVAAVAQNMMLTVVGGMRPEAQLQVGASIGKLPYGVSIATGTTCFLVARQLGFL